MRLAFVFPQCSGPSPPLSRISIYLAGAKRSAHEAGLDEEAVAAPSTGGDGDVSMSTAPASSSGADAAEIASAIDAELARQRLELRAELDKVEAERQALVAGASQ